MAGLRAGKFAGQPVRSKLAEWIDDDLPSTIEPNVVVIPRLVVIDRKPAIVTDPHQAG